MHSFFPSIDLDCSAPLKCLSTENLIAVYTLLLQEHQCLFPCSSGALLTEVMETLHSLLFPFDWQSLFVPRLPEAVAGTQPGLPVVSLSINNNHISCVDEILVQDVWAPLEGTWWACKCGGYLTARIGSLCAAFSSAVWRSCNRKRTSST
jgi:DENN (AEX-3) domain.